MEGTESQQQKQRSWSSTIALLIAAACPLILMGGQGGQSSQAMSVNGTAFFCSVTLLICLQALSTERVARLWSAAIVVVPLAWAIYLGVVLSNDQLVTFVQRDAATREQVRLSYLMFGVFHAAISCDQALRWRLGTAAAGLGLMLLGGAAMCWRLHDPAPIRLPLLNVCAPFALGFTIASATIASSTVGEGGSGDGSGGRAPTKGQPRSQPCSPSRVDKSMELAACMTI